MLWPYLLELVCNPNFNAAIVIVTRCAASARSRQASRSPPGRPRSAIADILTHKAENKEEVIINFELMPNLPKPQAVLARLMVLANVPFRKRGWGGAILDAMLTLGPLLHPR